MERLGLGLVYMVVRAGAGVEIEVGVWDGEVMEG